MRVKVCPCGRFGQFHELYLEAQTDEDRKQLERLERDYMTIGCGRTGDPLRMHHVRIELTPVAKVIEKHLGDS